MSETEKMPKRRENTRRRKRKFSLMDIVMYICASVLVIGAIYYFISHREQEQEQDGVAARSKSKSPGPKIKNGKTSTVTGKDLAKDKIKEDGNKKQNSIEPKVNGNKLKEKEKYKEREKDQEKEKEKEKNQEKEKEKDQEEEKKKDNETQESIKDKEPVKLADNEPTNNSNNSGDSSNNSGDNSNNSSDSSNNSGDDSNNSSVNDGSNNFNGEVKDKEDELKPENNGNSESDDVNTDHLHENEDDKKEQEQSTDTEVLKEEDSDSDPISVVEESKYPLFDVIKDGNMELFEKAIKNINNLETEVNDDGLNALHYAALLMKIDIMRFIIENGYLSVTEVIKEGVYAGNTALHWACLAAEKYPEHAIEAVELLLKHGAKLDAPDNNGYTPIFCAIQSGHLKLVEHLLAKDEKLIKTIREKDGNTLLHYAMGPCNSRPIMKLLIDKGAEVHAVNNYNREPIHEAAAMGCVDGLKELILTRRISKQTKSPSKSANKCKRVFEKRCLFGASPLHFAALYKKLEAVKFLFLIQSEFDAKDGKDKMAMYYTARGSDIENYFDGRLKWENARLNVQDVENLVRLSETLPQERREKAEEKLRMYHLHE